MLIPGAMTLALAFRSGGFFAGATGLAAAEMAVLTAVRFALARKPLVGFSRYLLVAVAAMAVLAGWTLLSANWSHSFARALPAYSEVVLYGLALVCFGSFPFNPARTRTMAWGVAGAIVIVCGAALTARLLPHLIFDPSLVDTGRLGYPLTYWNALGILACVGLVLCFHFSADAREPAPARILGAAAVPLLATTLLYTLSRGAIWAAVAALLLYLVVGRPRGVGGALLAAVPTTAFVLVVATPIPEHLKGYPDVVAGHGVPAVLLLCMAAAAGLRAAALPLDRAALRLRLPTPRREPLLAGGAAALALLAALFVALGGPGVASEKWSEFTDRADTGPAQGESRLLSARPEARLALWGFALDAYRENELHGTGAGTYQLAFERNRESDGHIVDAHSVYLEALGDLGLVGTAALILALVAILAAFAYRARGPDRALFAALLAAGLAWAVHAGVDWDWQMPAVTLWLFALGGTALSRSLKRRRKRVRTPLRKAAVRVGGIAACLVLAFLPAKLAISQGRLEDAIAALDRGDCGAARDHARSSLDAVGQRPAPYAVIGYCDLEQRRWPNAARAMADAQQRDPRARSPTTTSPSPAPPPASTRSPRCGRRCARTRSNRGRTKRSPRWRAAARRSGGAKDGPPPWSRRGASGRERTPRPDRRRRGADRRRPLARLRRRGRRHRRQRRPDPVLPRPDLPLRRRRTARRGLPAPPRGEACGEGSVAAPVDVPPAEVLAGDGGELHRRPHRRRRDLAELDHRDEALAARLEAHDPPLVAARGDDADVLQRRALVDADPHPKLVPQHAHFRQRDRRRGRVEAPERLAGVTPVGGDGRLRFTRFAEADAQNVTGPRRHHPPGGRPEGRVEHATAALVEPLVEAPVGAVRLQRHVGPDRFPGLVGAFVEGGGLDDGPGEGAVGLRRDRDLAAVERPDAFDRRLSGGRSGCDRRHDHGGAEDHEGAQCRANAAAGGAVGRHARLNGGPLRVLPPPPRPGGCRRRRR